VESSERSRGAELRARLEAWLDAQVDRHVRALKKLAAAATDRSSSPGVRALAAMLTDAGGVLPRRALVGAIAALEQQDRQTLHKLGIRLGPLDVFLHALLKPSSQQWRAALLAVRTNAPMPKLPQPGAAALGSDADGRGASLAYRRIGPQWLRIDLADRLASHAHKVRSAGGEEPVDQELATSVGLEPAALAKLMEEVGFTRTGEAWRWRGRRPPKTDRRATQSHAFAELAKLKR